MRSFVAVALLAACVSGCPVNMRPRPGTDGGLPGVDGAVVAACGGGTTSYCAGTTSVACNPDGTEGARTDCAPLGTRCIAGLGCRVCTPSRPVCVGNDSATCLPDGSGSTITRVCDASLGESCNPSSGLCDSPCAAAEASNSYIGCEYWPVTTLNSGLNRTIFSFAIAIANPQDAPATVTITRGGAAVSTVTVAAGALETVELPWVDALQVSTGSALVRGGAYRVRSTLPVTVYQFNPVDYTNGAGTFSFSNDASLLLPTHVMTGNYMVIARPTLQIEQVEEPFFPGLPETRTMIAQPGFATIVGVEETAVTVTVTFSAHVLASTDGAVTRFAPGATGTFTIGQGDVLQLVSAAPTACAPSGSSDADIGVTYNYCAVGPDYDLTGTEIRATGRVAVLSGHDCAFVPFDRWACDHLEEGMFPLESWGEEAIIPVSRPVRAEPNLIRVLSSHDANSISFDPPGVHAPVVLNRGEFIEFGSGASVRVTGTDALAVAQFLVGQDFAGFGAGAGGNGDPSFSLGIPTEQFRTSYTFLAPPSYEQNFVNVTAPAGASVMLDGAAVGGFTPIGDTGYALAQVTIPGGAHDITGSAEFGIVVYGYGQYTSYMYPGGLDLEAIDIPF